jgi:hypothetical protein
MRSLAVKAYSSYSRFNRLEKQRSARKRFEFIFCLISGCLPLAIDCIALFYFARSSMKGDVLLAEWNCALRRHKKENSEFNKIVHLTTF